MNPIVEKAVELYLADMGEDGCIGDASCECFGCLLKEFALDCDRADESRKQEFIGKVLEVRDRLRPIVEGEIERARPAVGQQCYGVRPGKRKTMLKDAREIAKHSVAALNNAINRWDRD